MLLDQLELVLRGGGLEQTLEFTQVPDTVSGSQLAGGLQESMWNHLKLEKQMLRDARRLVRPGPPFNESKT